MYYFCIKFVYDVVHLKHLYQVAVGKKLRHGDFGALQSSLYYVQKCMIIHPVIDDLNNHRTPYELCEYIQNHFENGNKLLSDKGISQIHGVLVPYFKTSKSYGERQENLQRKAQNHSFHESYFYIIFVLFLYKFCINFV